MSLQPTGERMVLEHYKSSLEDYLIYLMHIASYHFAEPFVRGRRILDYGCGSGYGSAMLARHAHHVTAVDIAADAIEYATQHHQVANLRFLQADPDAQLPFADQSFDVVLSFQVLEHVANVDHYLKEIRRVLAPRGCLLLITPDRSTRLLPLQRPWNRWHLYEFSAASLGRALARHFPVVAMQTMSGRSDVIGIELRRCRRLKWLTLPITLPIVPDVVRRMALNALHRFRGRSVSEQQVKPDFDASAIEIGPGLKPSLNLVAVAYLSTLVKNSSGQAVND